MAAKHGTWRFDGERVQACRRGRLNKGALCDGHTSNDGVSSAGPRRSNTTHRGEIYGGMLCASCDTPILPSAAHSSIFGDLTRLVSSGATPPHRFCPGPMHSHPSCTLTDLGRPSTNAHPCVNLSRLVSFASLAPHLAGFAAWGMGSTRAPLSGRGATSAISGVWIRLTGTSPSSSAPLQPVTVGQWPCQPFRHSSQCRLPCGCPSFARAQSSSITGTLPSRCGRETGGAHMDMILQYLENYAATHAHCAASYPFQPEIQLDSSNPSSVAATPDGLYHAKLHFRLPVSAWGNLLAP